VKYSCNLDQHRTILLPQYHYQAREWEQHYIAGLHERAGTGASHCGSHTRLVLGSPRRCHPHPPPAAEAAGADEDRDKDHDAADDGHHHALAGPTVIVVNDVVLSGGVVHLQCSGERKGMGREGIWGMAWRSHSTRGILLTAMPSGNG
jgi:hypothetical protein